MIEPVDLEQFADRALARLERLFVGHPAVSAYRRRLRLLCLVQGGALHYLDRRTGLKDIDVLGLFEILPDMRFPARPILHADFGPSKFGRSQRDPGYAGRRMDIMGRAIAFGSDETPTAAGRRYILTSANASPSAWRRKAGIAIWPGPLRGTLLWTPV